MNVLHICESVHLLRKVPSLLKVADTVVSMKRNLQRVPLYWARATFARVRDNRYWKGVRLDSPVVVFTDPSQVFQWLTYEPQTKSLVAEFVGGARYRYDEVPSAVAQRLFRAKSPGRFFNKRIRPTYKTWKLV